ncbi:gfo/Idh/MocA family oxidoreductase [Candidatus Bathyarchaeota archaeon]|nr:MAG: gfo/Idh/MocA family oxidoreductase [Candidatus Bathyarchaeota archaeon]
MVSKPVKLAVVGGRRGRAFNKALGILSDKVQLVAICDISEEVLKIWKKNMPYVQTFKDYDEMLEKSDCDAVFIATPIFLHAKQSIKAMKAGKHVLSEVVAATTLDECWRLVETVEDTGMTYMLSENYCYMRPNMMILNMVEKGVFGELIYAEGGYIHDCRDLLFYPDGKLTWRGEASHNFPGNTYPTHSLGPIAQWLHVNREDGDRLLRTATFMTKSVAVPIYVKRLFGESHPGAKREFWKRGDSATTVIQTERDVVIVLRVDYHSPRPHNMAHHVLQGSSASYLSARYRGEDPLIWIEGRSPGQSPPKDAPAEWESLWKYADEYEHPRWKRWGKEAMKTGHGGGDFFVLEDFVDSILQRKDPPIDVYDAVTWSCIVPLSIESVKKGNIPVEIPDFRKKC